MAENTEVISTVTDVTSEGTSAIKTATGLVDSCHSEVTNASNIITTVSTLDGVLTSLGSNALSQLNSNLSKVSSALNTANSYLQKVGMSASLISELAKGNLGDISEIALGLVKQVLPLKILKKLTPAELKSIAISLYPPNLMRHGVAGTLTNIAQSLGLTFKDILNSEIVKSILQNAGVPAILLKNIDLTNITSMSGLKTAILEASGLDKMSDAYQKLKKDLTEAFNNPTNFLSDAMKRQAFMKLWQDGKIKELGYWFQNATENIEDTDNTGLDTGEDTDTTIGDDSLDTTDSVKETFSDVK